MNKTVLSIVIIFLLIGAGVVSSTNNNTEMISIINKSLNTINNQKVISDCDHLAYIGGSGESCGLYELKLNDPGNLTCYWPGQGGSAGFISGSTWTTENTWLACQYDTGALWEIDLETGDMYMIGGGGIGCNGLAWDIIWNRLYGASGTGLYEYNPETGEQEFIGSFGLSGKTIIGIAISVEGGAFIWDIVSSGSSTLWEVDLETAEVTEVGPLGLTLNYNQDGDFCQEDDIFYLATYTTYPNVGNFLYECDYETGSCSLVGEFQEEVEVSLFVIPYTCCNTPPVTTISFEPPEPDGCNGWYVSDVNVTLNATDDDGVKTIYYKIPGDDWKSHSGDSIKILLDQDCLTGMIEFYSVDNKGNQEEIKSVDINIDQLPPNMQVWYNVTGGNPLKGWDILFTAYGFDNCSGMDRVEFYLNGGLQAVVSGAGPIYSWGFTYYGDIQIDIGVNYCDNACNCEYYEIPVKSRGNNIQFLMNQLLFRLLERFPLLLRFLNSN